MKILSVKHNNRRKVFEVTVRGGVYPFPYSKADPQPSVKDRIERLVVDAELANEAFTYVLNSGSEGTVHVEQVLDYNRDPRYLRDQLLYKLSLEARERVRKSPLSKRELIRRLDTSATQLYRLLDQTNHSKSIDQMLRLLYVLDCDVDLQVRTSEAGRGQAA